VYFGCFLRQSYAQPHMESFRRDLLNDVAEHRSILKNYHELYYPRFNCTPKTDIAFPKTDV